MDDLSGTRLGRYRVGRLLGSGGMGAVYAGVQEPLGRPVAIKVLRPEISTNPSIVARFQREAELAASLSHPNIAQVTDFGVEEGRAFLVMDLLEGESLAQLLEHEPRLTEARTQRITMQVLTALAMAHDRGVVHRDLKPENIFVQRVSGMELIKLLDFGIAHMIDVDHSMTNTGAVLGTPAYMSPEQARGRKVDARSDVFSLGAVLYQMLSGRRPFEKDNYHELMFAVVEEQPSALTDITPALASLIERAMHKTPEVRYADASEMRDALGAIANLPERLPSGAIAVTRDSSQGAFAATMASDPEGGVLAAKGPHGSAPGARTVGPGAGEPMVDPASPATAPRRLRRIVGIVAIVGVVIAIGMLIASRRETPVMPARVATAVVEADDAGIVMQPIGAAPGAAPEAAPEPASASAPAPVPGPPPRGAPRATLPRSTTLRCDGSEVEVPIVVPGDDVRATSVMGIGDLHGVSTSVARAAVNQHAAAMARCYRGHALLRGQDYRMTTDTTGRVQTVAPRIFCPIDPPVVACMERALAGVVVPDTGGNEITFQVGLTIVSR